MNPQPAQTAQPEQPLQPVQQPVQNIAFHHQLWETFENILMFISLYIVATATGLILHSIVDKYFPDPAKFSAYAGGSYYSDSLKWSLAAIFVTLPIFSLLYFDLIRRARKNLNLRNLSSHKGLLYITLFITFIIMIGNLIRAVFTLIDGSLILNFILHFIVTIGISGLIFVNFILQVKDDRQQSLNP